MIKMAVVHVSGPKMTPEYRFTVENQPGGMAAFQNKVNERTMAEMAELNALIADGYEKFDAQKFTFSDGEAIIYLMHKPDPPLYVVERFCLDHPIGTGDWEQVGEGYADYKAALKAKQELPTADYNYRIREVSHVQTA